MSDAIVTGFSVYPIDRVRMTHPTPDNSFTVSLIGQKTCPYQHILTPYRKGCAHQLRHLNTINHLTSKSRHSRVTGASLPRHHRVRRCVEPCLLPGNHTHEGEARFNIEILLMMRPIWGFSHPSPKCRGGGYAC